MFPQESDSTVEEEKVNAEPSTEDEISSLSAEKGLVEAVYKLEISPTLSAEDRDNLLIIKNQLRSIQTGMLSTAAVVNKLEVKIDHLQEGTLKLAELIPKLTKQAAVAAKELGNEEYKKNNFEGALEHYRKAMSLDPINMTYKTNIAAVYFEQKKYEDCIKECLDATELGRENRADFKLIAKAFTRIANAYRKLGEFQNAKVFYEKSLSEHRTPETRALLAEIEKIIKVEELKAYVDPVKAEEAKEKGNDLFKKGDFAGAMKHYSEAIMRNPDDPKQYSNRAACYTKLAAFDLGLRDCDKCNELDPKFIKGWIRKGKILQGMQDASKAMNAYQRALEIDPSNSEALEGYQQTMRTAHSDPEEMRKQAMSDPEVQAILRDPAKRMIVEQMQSDRPLKSAKTEEWGTLL